MVIEISKVSKNGSALNVEWSDGEKSNFNFMWLRDNCPSAHDKDSRHRMFNILEISTNIEPKKCKINNEGKLEVEWNEGNHISYYDQKWLRQNCYTIKNKKKYISPYQLWDSSLEKNLNSLSKKYSKLPMLAFTHGQPASPTSLGKEFSNFSYRMKFHLDQIKSVKQKGKFNGASGNYNAHIIAQNNLNWEVLSKKFVNSLGLDFSSHSTQIELKDAMAFQLANIHNLNNVLIDFAQDIWLLISKNYLKQNLKSGEVGSSTMPHKVNPIDFENAEGNLSIANGLIIALKNKIQISRLQRDLSDSTVLRNIGSLFAYIIISLNSLKKGIAKIEPNKENILKDLDNSWEILTEAIQTILRKNGVEDSYTKIKSISRGKKLDYHSYIKIIDDLKINKADKELLLSLTPKKYIGLADKLAKSSFKS